MDLTIGLLLEGTVKSITNFGAFVRLDEHHSGLVHISEVSTRYVNDIREHLTEGQTIRVKIIAIDANGKISLSIRQAQEKPKPVRPVSPVSAKPPQTFEEKLKQFMSDSDSKISACRRYEHKTKSRRR